MIRRIVVFLAVALATLSAFAGENRDRDILLTNDGVLYIVESAHDPNAEYGQSAWYLSMTVRHGEGQVTVRVPGSTTGGTHSNPALGYDPESRTLFLFWQESLNGGLSSRLLFSSYRNGMWAPATALDSVDWNLRRNLRIAVTRTAEQVESDGRTVAIPQLNVHAVWWEETGYGEWARYAMIGIDGGTVVSKDIRFLGEFAGAKIDNTQPLRSASDEILRHPAIAATGTKDSVDVVFGDADTTTMRRVRIKPVLNGRLRIPIGVRETHLRHAELNVAPNSRTGALLDDNELALYTITNRSLDYIIYRDGSWTNQRSIALSADLSAEAALEALRKLISD